MIYHGDNIEILRTLADDSIDLILTDPPYLYLKGQKLEREFDEKEFFTQCKRVLKDDGFLVFFGRGSSFYRWNTICEELGFIFKEEIIWDKSHGSSPLMKITRVHETIAIHTKKSGAIRRVKIPYLEMKGHDISSIIRDIKRLRTTYSNAKSLEAVQKFLENNIGVNTNQSMKCGLNEKTIIKNIEFEETKGRQYAHTMAKDYKNYDRCVAVVSSLEFGMSEKTIIRTDRYDADNFTKHGVNCDKRQKGDKCADVMQSMEFGLNEKSIIRDNSGGIATANYTSVSSNVEKADRCCSVIQSMEFGLNEKTIIKEIRNHYKSIHPTEKPVRLLERLMMLTSDKGATVLDPFAGSGSTAIACINQGRKHISIEIDKEYFEAAQARILEAQKRVSQAHGNEVITQNLFEE